MTTFLRYARLYGCFLRFSFSRAMEFRLDFFFRVVMDSVWYAVQLAFFWLVYRHTNLLGNWTLDQAFIFTSGYMLVDAINMTVFSNNLWWLPQMINKGDLDYYLVRPVSSLFFVTLRDFAANSFLNLVIASGIMIWAIGRYPGPLTAGNIVMFLVLLVLGLLIFSMIQVIFLIPTFWLQSAAGCREICFTMARYGERPDQIFKGWVRRVIVSIVPFGVVTSFPTHVLFGEGGGMMALHMVVVAMGLFVAMLVAWHFGLKAYGSASS